jgi:hypothetical protein
MITRQAKGLKLLTGKSMLNQKIHKKIPSINTNYTIPTFT